MNLLLFLLMRFASNLHQQSATNNDLVLVMYFNEMKSDTYPNTVLLIFCKSSRKSRQATKQHIYQNDARCWAVLVPLKKLAIMANKEKKKTHTLRQEIIASQYKSPLQLQLLVLVWLSGGGGCCGTDNIVSRALNMK